jgi:parvulin-like peptidyl-prolyl isomerase
VRHIVQADQTSAAAVETRLKNGENWATIALTISTDSPTKGLGGDMGWFPKGIKDPVLEAAAFAAPIGKISDPIQTQAGWEVFQVVGHETRPVDASTLTQLQSNSFQTWLTNARAKLTVVKNNNWNQRIPVDPTIDPTDLLVPTQIP